MDSVFQELLGDFLLESRERLDKVEEILLALPDLSTDAFQESLTEAKRELHTLKGNSGMMGFRDLQAVAHEVEDRVGELDAENPEIRPALAGLDRFRKELKRRFAQEDGAQGEVSPDENSLDEASLEEASQELALGSVRVPFPEVDGLVELLAEVLLYRNRLEGALESVRPPAEELSREDSDSWTDLAGTYDSLQKTLHVLQDRILKLRMVPLQSLFRHLARIVHDESEREGKEVRFRTEGGDTPLDKGLLELASEALGHLVRNAVTHGIESQEERRESGKHSVGSLRLKAMVQAQEVHIEVTDDGAGIDLDHLRQRAKELGEPLVSDQELYSLLFRAGFSTREGTDLSAGRGIGLFAVQEAVRRFRGRMEIHSEHGAGSRFLLRLPLSVSIARALLVRVDEEEFAIPIVAVVESSRVAAAAIETAGHGRVVRWRKQFVPLVDLGRWMSLPLTTKARGFVVLVESLGRKVALEVDALVGIQDIVVKGMAEILGSPKGISGSTILGDGRVILILDVLALAESMALQGEGQDTDSSQGLGDGRTED